MWEEFKKFAIKGNAMDLAVGVIIGGAFGKIITSLVNDIIMPILGLFLGGINFTDLQVHFGKAVIKYGAFTQSVFDFLIVAVTIFLFIRLISNLKKKESASPVIVEVRVPSQEEVLLGEIRDLLKQK